MPTRVSPARLKRTQPPQDYDRRRGIVICVTLSVFLGVSIFAATYAATTKPNPHAAYAAFLAQANELRAGDILFVPVEGNVCRRRVIDNQTWQIKDAGDVICDEAVSWNAHAPNQKYFVAVRVDAIRSGFRTPSE